MTLRLLVFLLISGGTGGSLTQALASTPQEQADFLAGLPLSKNSALAELQKSAEYRDHQKELRDQWAFCRRVRYEAMQQWGRDHLARAAATRSVVRYLFGGPDFLNAYAFFPEARIMVLGGLEPVGAVPPPESLDAATFSAGLKALRETLHTSLFCGYFITSEMKPQLVQGSFRGVLPVLFTELALTGNKVLSVEMVKPFGSPGVKILYARYDPRGDAQPQTLYYFQADLGNGTECKRFLAWMGDLGQGASYLKAASYLLPLDSFSQARSFLINTSTLILQDDSGIPFQDFLPTEWNIQLFGLYTDPLSIFKTHREAALDAAYATTAYAGPLSFGAGYHVNPRDANLLLATRVTAENPAIPRTPLSVTPLAAAPTPLPIPLPTPQPPPMPVRKALPVDAVQVRKALPVEVEKAVPVSDPTHPVPEPPLPQ